MVHWPKFIGIEVAKTGPAGKPGAEQVMDGDEHLLSVHQLSWLSS